MGVVETAQETYVCRECRAKLGQHHKLDCSRGSVLDQTTRQAQVIQAVIPIVRRWDGSEAALDEDVKALFDAAREAGLV